MEEMQIGRYSIEEILPLGAGPCTYCEECAFHNEKNADFRIELLPHWNPTVLM